MTDVALPALAAPARRRAWVRFARRRVGAEVTITARVTVATVAGIGAGLVLRALEVPVWLALVVAYPALGLVLAGTAALAALNEEGR